MKLNVSKSFFREGEKKEEHFFEQKSLILISGIKFKNEEVYCISTLSFYILAGGFTGIESIISIKCIENTHTGEM